MAPPKRKANPSTSDEAVPATTPIVNIEPTPSPPSEDLPPIKVNNASLTDLKNALDDATKAYFNRGDAFKQSYVHEDVRIGFGWLSCLIAGGITFYGWKMGWASTKGWTAFGVAAYAVISSFLWVYAKFVEKEVVYMGIRRSVAKRVLTEELTISSHVPPHTPIYKITFNYKQSTNGGKVITRSWEESNDPEFRNYFDVNGRLDVARWEQFLSGFMARALGEA